MRSLLGFFLVALVAKTAFAGDENLLPTTNARWPPDERGQQQQKPRFLTFMISPGRTSTRSTCVFFSQYLHQRCAHNMFGMWNVKDVESFVEEGSAQNQHLPTNTNTTRFESALDEAVERKRLTFFTDVPFFMPGMPCRLLAKYPEEARFLYVHRDRAEHFDSVLRMNCKWDAPIHCLNANNKALRERLWGSYFHTFCDEHSKICGENPDDKVIKKNNLTALMSSIWSAHLDEYEQSVRECIPTSKLLNISLGWYNETSETKRFQSFFGLPEENNDSLALRFSRLHINDDLMPGRRQRMFNNNNNESTSGGKWRPLIMLTGPEQSSTLVSGAMRKALNETFELGMSKVCPKELINPGCQTSKHRAELYAKCIPSNGPHLIPGQKAEMWNTCSSSDLENVFREAKKLGSWEFTKDTHLNGWHLKTLHKRGHPLFVVFRKPEHTFPVKGKYQYFAFWRSLMSTTPENLRMLPAGADLLRLRNHARNVFNGILKQTDHRIFSGTTGIRGVQECLGHFFHFWHLITVAKSLNVPVFSVESLLLANSRDEALIALKASGACTLLSIGSAEMCEAFVDNLREMQSVPTWMHVNVTKIFKDASSFSSVSLLLDREKKYYEQTKCAPVLSTVTSWCRDNIRNCATVSDLYSGATVGTTLDYLSPLKQGGVTNIDEIFNRTFSRGLLLQGGEERTTEAKRLQYSVIYAVVIMGALLTIAELVRFFRSRKER